MILTLAYPENLPGDIVICVKGHQRITQLISDLSFTACQYIWASQGALEVKNLLANAGDIRDLGSIPGLGRSPGGGHGNPLQCSCLGNPHG